MSGKNFGAWFMERAMGAGLFGLFGGFLGGIFSQVGIGFIAGAIIGWLFTSHKSDRGELPFGGDDLS